MSRRRAPREVEHRQRPESRRSPAPELGGDQVEGRHAVRELLAVAPRRPTIDVTFLEEQESSDALEEIADLARQSGVPVRTVSRDAFRSLAQTSAPQGVIARARPVEPSVLDDLVKPGPAGSRPTTPAGGVPFLVVLSEVTDPYNVGAILRSVLAAGATGVIVGRHRSAHLPPAAVKAAAGAVEHLPIAVVGGIPQALADLAQRGIWTIALDLEGDRDLDDLEIATEPLALVAGAEGRGLAPLAKKRCDVSCRIPLYGPMESLNVSVATAIAAFAVAKRRAADGPVPRSTLGIGAPRRADARSGSATQSPC